MPIRMAAVGILRVLVLGALVLSCDSGSESPTAPIPVEKHAALVSQSYTDLDSDDENHSAAADWGRWRVSATFAFFYSARSEGVVVRPLVRSYGSVGNPANNFLDQTRVLPDVWFPPGSLNGTVTVEFDVCEIARDECGTDFLTVEYQIFVGNNSFSICAYDPAAEEYCQYIDVSGPNDDCRDPDPLLPIGEQCTHYR